MPRNYQQLITQYQSDTYWNCEVVLVEARDSMSKYVISSHFSQKLHFHNMFFCSVDSDFIALVLCPKILVSLPNDLR